jgi:uncharacterized protein (TIGR02246 family)
MSDEDGALQRLVDIEAIKQLRARYTRAIDTKDWDLVRACLAEDARFATEGGANEGRDTIVAFVSRSLTPLRTVHHVHTPEITFDGPDAASGVWAMNDYVEMVRDGESVWTLRGYGHYLEDYARGADGWQLKSSTLTRLRVDMEGVPSGG